MSVLELHTTVLQLALLSFAGHYWATAEQHVRPPRILVSASSSCYLHCNATATSLNLVINNLTFFINAVDLKNYDGSQSLYISAVAADSDGHSEPIIEEYKGSLFLRLTIWCCLSVPS